jgi:predicted nucleic acid-binding protein
VSVVYDAGALIAADRSDRNVWADHRVRLGFGVVPLTTSPVVAQVTRSGRQAELRRFLRGCDIVPFAQHDAHEVGFLAGRSANANVVDVHVVIVAHRHGFGVLTTDQDDLRPVADALPARVPIFPV